MDVPIHNLFFTAIEPPFVTKGIRKYFERFGEVDFVQFHLDQNFEHGFVQFKDTECAKAVLSEETHCVSNCRLTMNAADNIHQPNFKAENLELPPQQDSLSHIFIALNDDCLREIFLRLKALDLSRAAEVCVRFKQLSTEAFAAMFKHLKFNSETVEFHHRRFHHDFGALFTNFGPLINSLHVDGNCMVIWRLDHLKAEFLHIIGQCGTLNLQELELTNFTIESDYLDSIFPKLEKLTLNSCNFDEKMTELLATARELKILKFYRCQIPFNRHQYWQCIAQEYEKLQEIYLIENGFNDAYLKNCMILNPMLTRLSIKEPFIDISEISYLAGLHLPDLLVLEIDCMNSTQHSIYQDYIWMLDQLATNNVSIQELRLRGGKLNIEAIDHILQLNQITILELVDIKDLTDAHVIELAKKLPQLQELIVDYIVPATLKKIVSLTNKLSIIKIMDKYNHKINEDDYNAMLKSIQKRPEQINLLIEITSDGNNVNVSSETLTENHHFIDIKEHIDDADVSSEDSYDIHNYSVNYDEIHYGYFDMDLVDSE
ncbi:uncharacterized protein LOC129570888 [Sitodiplosis mosellana]|uniref:uncharacterized protein LOC129570888 n=1 Tax=Sitodiplosis mosellana TaxID=263140 RepID=UPI00244386C8|nr:uncharacterized protein LOC129570888 [Sitodiplosis mosellana]